MAEQDDERHGELPREQAGDTGTPSSDTGDIHRPRPAVERTTEEGTAGQGLGQVSGATREDAGEQG